MRNAESSSASTQDQILNAALQCFAELGYDGATLADIRQRAKVSVGSLYHWFTNKEELSAALYVQGLRDYQSGVHSVLEKSRSAEKGIREMVHHHLEWVQRHPDWARHLLTMRRAELVGPAKEDLRRMNGDLYNALERWRKPYVSSGVLVNQPMELFVAAIMGPAHEYVRLWLSGSARTEIAVAKKALAEAAWRSVRRDP